MVSEDVVDGVEVESGQDGVSFVLYFISASICSNPPPPNMPESISKQIYYPINLKIN